MKLLFLIYAVLSLSSVSAIENETKAIIKIIKVGAVDFPPYIIIDSNGRISGIITETLNVINSIQNKYRFVAIPTSAMRRHEDFKKGLYDMSFYDNLDWGWDKSQAVASNVFMKGKEIYIARSEPGRGEEYFQSFKDKTMVGMLGYHYSFAKFNADPNYLRKTFNMQFSTSNESSIKMILYKRGNIAIVSDAYLNWYLLAHPNDRVKLLISKKVDQHYSHKVISRKNFQPNIAEINSLLAKFKKSQEFKDIEKRYGVTP